MRFFGHHRFSSSDSLPASQLGLLFLLLAGALSPLHGQAPYVLPYTMSTFAGGTVANGGTTPSATINTGASCAANGKAPYALDSLGDGCPAASVLIATDPHDVRIDNRGNVFYGNNSNGMVHKFNPYTFNMSAYVGNLASAASCTKAGVFGTADKYGDGCNATDGVANNSLNSSGTAALFTPLLKGVRGLGLAPNGNLFIASYNDDLVHEVSASSGFFSIIAGTLPSGTATPGTANGPSSGSSVNTPRGVGADASGNVFVADTGNNVIRLVNQFTAPSSAAPTYTPGVVSYYTALNTAKTVSTAVGPYASALVNAPEDVKVDGNGNIYIADFGNGVVRAIYNAKGIGTLPNVAAPIAGNIYVVAGNGGTANPNNSYPTAGTTPVSALSVQLGGVRKISLDSRNNLYIADSGSEVVWFVDATTGFIRPLAGSFGQTATSVTTTRPAWVCSTGTNAIGDGCPGTQANLDAASNMGADVDSQGNLYITDAEGGGSGLPRIRKQLSGLNFPATTASAPITQNILIHFAVGDTPATTNAYTLSSNPDFVLNGTPVCTTQPDSTTDCLLTVTFTPSKSGFETSNLIVASQKNGATPLVLTGTGTAAAVAFDPGNTSLLNSTATNPQGVAVDPAGNVYIADTANNRIILYSTTNGTSVFAGGSPATCSAGGSDSIGDGCAATAATFSKPSALALGTDGYLYIADTGNNAVRRINLATGIISLWGGLGTACSQASDSFGDNCSALNATFNAPAGLAADNLGNLFVADTGNNIIREIGRNGWVSLLAGGGSSCSAATDTLGDGCPATQTTFSKPTGLAFDITGHYVVVADTGNSDVRKIYLDATFAYSPATGTPTTSTNIVVNPVTLVAGVGQPQSTVNQSSIAALSGLANPTGVAVDSAENIYIADTGNHAVRLVTPGTGVISTIAGILGTSGTGTVPSSATVTQLNLPSAIAVSPLGTLYIADAGNNRVLTDVRSNISYNFGRTNQGFASPVQNITEVNISTLAVTPLAFTQATANAQFTLVPTANSNSSIPACSGSTLASGTACNLQGQFTPTGLGSQSATFTQVGSNVIGTAPSITLIGFGAVLTPTTATVSQSVPATGNAQFGGPLTFTTTVTPSACNTAAPACYPSGTVTFVVDGTPSAPITLTGRGSSLTLPLPSTASYSPTGLAVQTHTVSCNYSGDFYYAPFTCPTVNIPVVQASTKSTLTFTPGTNNLPQYPTNNCGLVPTTPAVPTSGDNMCTQTTLVATVASTTVGIPTGSVTFLVNGAPLVGNQGNPVGLNPNGVASFPLTFYTTSNGTLDSLHAVDGSLAPGTYTLSCVFNGPSGSNFAGSTCAPVQFTVVPQVASMTLVTRGCIASALYPAGSFTAVLGSQCGNGFFTNGIPTVATADGSTTDATIFLLPSNTLSGNITFSCSGLPTNTACTFQPTSIALTAGTAYAAPVYTDVTFFTDVKSTSSIAKPSNGIALASVFGTRFGWPLSAFSLLALLVLRRKKSLRGLSLLAMVVLMAGSALTFSGCAGPGNYTPSLTPAGTYPVTITATGAGITSTTVVDLTVTAPGIIGQQ
jgi:sugar lactone lactonase YvrE